MSISRWMDKKAVVHIYNGVFSSVQSLSRSVVSDSSRPRESQHAIKKNTFESVLMRWMKVEPIIQSEVSQKEKHQYSIVMHIYGI